jgi:hypothetical protein
MSIFNIHCALLHIHPNSVMSPPVQLQPPLPYQHTPNWHLQWPDLTPHLPYRHLPFSVISLLLTSVRLTSLLPLNEHSWLLQDSMLCFLLSLRYCVLSPLLLFSGRLPPLHLFTTPVLYYLHSLFHYLILDVLQTDHLKYGILSSDLCFLT